MGLDNKDFLEKQKEMLEIQHTKTETKTEVKTAQPVPAEATVTEVKVEQPVQRNAEATKQMTGHAQALLSDAVVNYTAEGQPMQHEEAPRFSWKKWKRDKQKEAIARANGCQVPSAISYDLAQQMKVHERRKNNVSETILNPRQLGELDGRLMRGFSRGFELDAQGKPLTEQDAENMRLDSVLCDDYCSKCLEHRVPHLNRIMQEFFSIPITEDILSEENLRSRAADLDRWGMITTAIDNLLEDPINEPYFNLMDPQKKQEMKDRRVALINVSNAFTASFNCHGVKRTGVYNIHIDAGVSAIYQAEIVGSDKAYQKSREALQKKWKEQEGVRKSFLQNKIFQTHAKVLKKIGKLPKGQIEEAAENYKWKSWMKNEIFTRLKGEMDLTSDEKGSVYMERGAVLMKEGVAHEEENRKTLLLLRELQKIGVEKTPSADLYLQAKNLVKPRVDKVLNLDIAKWKNMSELELISHMEELNELFLDGMFVADLMKLKHHDQKNVGLTLKDEILGQRKDEYSLKSSILRALAEKTRALAILAKAANNGRFEDIDFIESEADKMYDGKETFLNRRLNMAEELIRASEAKWKSV